MRTIFILFLISIFYVPELSGQEKNNGFEVTFLLIHPVKKSLNHYEYSVDPTLEVLYFTSLTKKLRVGGGLLVQAGKHNWLELYGHTFYYDNGMPYRFRTNFNRRLEFFSVGIPVQLEIKTNNIIFDSFVLGFTAGSHLKLEMADFYDSKYVASFPVFDYFNPMFREFNFGFRKIIFQSPALTFSLSPVAGCRKESSRIKDIGYYNYLFYGLGLSMKFGK
jgi:hypothetical protein